MVIFVIFYGFRDLVIFFMCLVIKILKNNKNQIFIFFIDIFVIFYGF